jgi:DNA-binding CsgD family transcriptional regulator
MKSSRLTEADYRAIYQILGECQEVGDDVAVWLRHFYAGLARLIDADVVMGGEMGGLPDGPLRTLGVTDWGFEAGFHREGWLEALEWFDRDPLEHPIFRSLVDRLHRQSGATLPRRQLVEDGDWYRSEAFDVIHRTAGTDATLHSFLPVPQTHGDYSGMILNRALRRRGFDEREQRLVAFAHAELTPSIGRSLARFDEPRPSDLAPRVRAVLRCVLEGDGDKQIAGRLNLSRHTVNQYLKTLYRHFGVCGRGELLARWIRRGWSARCEWVK